MTLYEIKAEIAACTDPETGEIIDYDRLVELHMEREEKLENVALWIKNLSADIKAFREEEKAFADRRHAAENKVESLKEFLLMETEGKPFKTARCSVSVRNNAEAPHFANESAFIEWAEKNAEELLRYKQPEIDRTAVKQYLKDGNEIDGVTLERSQSVIIK